MNEAAGYSRAAAPAADGARGKKADPGLEEKPFRLVKSFSVAAIGLIFATALTLAAVVSRQAEKIISNRVEDDTIKLMENLNNQMFYGFLIPARLRFGQIQLRHPEQQALLNEVITRTIHGFDIRRVLIYDPAGEVVYATDQTLLRTPVDDIPSFNRAVDLYWTYYSRNLWLYIQDLWLPGLKFTADLAAVRPAPVYVQPDPRRFLRPPDAPEPAAEPQSALPPSSSQGLGGGGPAPGPKRSRLCVAPPL